MARKTLSDTYIKSKQHMPAKGERTLVMDTENPRLRAFFVSRIAATARLSTLAASLAAPI